MKTDINREVSSAARIFVLAGLVGGMAEVVWILLYGMAADMSAAEVSRGVVFTLFPAVADSAIAPFGGLVIHMALSLMLAAAIGLSVWQSMLRRFSLSMHLLMCTGILIAIWAVNFFLLLPAMNPVFVSMLPYPITFVSKALFGLSMGMLLYRHGDHATGAHVPVAVRVDAQGARR